MQTVTPEQCINNLPMPITLLGTFNDGKHNVMTAGWVAQATKNPVEVLVAVNKQHTSHDMIKNSKEFVVSVLNSNQQQAANICGRNDGNQTDKIQMANLQTSPATQLQTPLINGCTANLECKLADSFDVGDHTIFVGEVVAGHVENNQPLIMFQQQMGSFLQ